MLDTNALIWSLIDRRRLSSTAIGLIEDEANDVFVSVISAWEIEIKAAKGKLQAPGDLQSAVAAHPFEPRPGVRVSLSISAGASRFPMDGTSFDELMAAADEKMYHDKAGRRSRSSGRHVVQRSERA